MDKLDQSLGDIIKSSVPSGRGSSYGRARRGRPAPYGGRPAYGRGRGGKGGGFQVSHVPCQLYVGNLSYDVSWQDLKDHMRMAGDVSRCDILMGPDGRSKGCGIVAFEDQVSAARAITSLTNTELKGRMIFVREDREAGGGGGYAPGLGGKGSSFGGKGGAQAYKPTSRVSQAIRREAPADCKVFVGQLPWSIKWQALKDMCKAYGEIRRADVEEDMDGRSKGYGTVVFANADDASACIEGLNGTDCEGRSLDVHLDTKGSKGAGEFKVFVGNLPWSIGWQGLKDLVRPYGEVAFADVAEGYDGRSRGFGVVSFKTVDQAYSCIEGLNGAELEGRVLIVKEDKENPLN